MPSQYIGEILVHLRADAASWVSGLEQATKEMQKFGRNVERDFRQLGNSLSFVAGTFGAFGAQGAAVAQALTAMGRVAGSTINAMAKWNPVLGVAAGGLGGLTAGAVSLGAVLIGTSVHAANAAAQVYHLSQSTGIAAPTLAALTLAGRAAGLDMEVMAKGLERMSKNALLAATTTSTIPSAFERLKVSVVDSKGHLKDVEQLMLEVADKFAAMQDGSYKTGLAIQIFGRSGAALIPVLNMGKQGLAEWVNFAKRVGAAMGTDAYRGAEQFHSELVRGEAVLSGSSNQIMTGMLPALTQLVHSLFDVSSDGKTFVAIGREIGEVMKDAALGAGGLAWALRQLNLQPQLAAAKMDLSKLMRETAGGTRFTLEQGAQIQADKKLIAELETALADADQKWGQLQNDMNTPGKLPAIPKGGGQEEDLSTGDEERNRKLQRYRDLLVHQITLSEKARQAAIALRQALTGAAGGKFGPFNAPQELPEEVQQPAPELKPLLPSLGPEGAPLLEQQLDKFWDEHGKYVKQGEDDIKAYYQHLEEVQEGLRALGEITEGELAKRLSALHLEKTEILKRNEAEQKQAKRESVLDLPIMKKAQDTSENLADEDAVARAMVLYGSLGDKVTGIFTEIELAGMNTSGKIAEEFSRAFSESADALARFVVTGKGGFAQLGQSLLIEVVHHALQAMESKLVGFFVKKLALEKASAAQSAASSGTAAAASQKEFKPAAATAAAKAYSALAGIPIVGPVLGAAAAAGAFALLSGFLATGGPAEAGKYYIVGERGPELFAPGVSGHVYPNTVMQGGGPKLQPMVSVLAGGGEHHIHLNVQALDSKSVADSISEHRDMIAALMKEHLREANQI